MADRINRNLRWVDRQLKLAGMNDVVEEEILDAFSRIELDILTKSSDLRDITVITFDSTPPHDTGNYPLPATAHRVFVLSQPAKWSQKCVLTSDPEYYEQVKSDHPTGTQPLVALQINDNLNFWPVPTNGDSVTIYSIATMGTEYGVVEGGDHTVTWHWDSVLRYGALSMLLPAGNAWEVKYEKEFNSESHKHIQQSGAPTLIDHSSRRLGF